MEITEYAVRECYVYAALPPPGSAGYRAHNWDVDNWEKEVTLKVLTAGDDVFIKLFDKETNELFVECPVDNDKPVQSSVEAVLDSSRYFVLKVVDSSSGRHAFIGIGFRERHEATDFLAALSDHRQYLQRKQKAEKLRNEYSSQPDTQKDYSIKPGEKIKIRLPKLQSREGHCENKEQQGSALVNNMVTMNSNDSSAEDEWGDFIGV